MISNPPHKILIVSNTYWYLYNFRAQLISLLLQQGWHVTLAAGKDNYEDSWSDTNVEIYTLKHLERRGTSPLRDLALWQEFRQLKKDLRPDIILSHTIKPNIFCTLGHRSESAPVVCFISGLGSSIIQGGVLARVVRSLYKKSLVKSDRIYCENLDDLSYIHSLLPNHGDLLHHIAGTGVDCNYYVGSNISLPREKTHFLYAGRLIGDKGINELIEASRNLDPSRFHLHVAGQNDLDNPSAINSELLRNWFNQDYVTHHGFVTDIRPLMTRCDAVILASYREGLSRSLLEAMAMSRPILCSDVPGCAELVEPGINGFLFKPRSASDLAMKMSNFMSLDREEIQRMAHASRTKVLTQYSSTHINEQLLNYINSKI